LYGIRRALRLAGSRAQILALWDVDREATSQFVRAFYQTWPGGGSVEDAFKAAQRQVRGLWSNDPYYWAHSHCPALRFASYRRHQLWAVCDRTELAVPALGGFVQFPFNLLPNTR